MSKPTSLLACVWLLSFAVSAPAQELVTLSTRPGVTQAYFIASLPKDLQAIAVLFPGSGGSIRLRQEKGEVR